MVIEITRLNLQEKYAESTITGVDREGNELVFHFLPETQIRRLTPQEIVQSLRQMIAEASEFPLKKEQEVLVSWKPLAGGQKLAVKFTIY